MRVAVPDLQSYLFVGLVRGRARGGRAHVGRRAPHGLRRAAHDGRLADSSFAVVDLWSVVSWPCLDPSRSTSDEAKSPGLDARRGNIFREAFTAKSPHRGRPRRRGPTCCSSGPWRRGRGLRVRSRLMLGCCVLFGALLDARRGSAVVPGARRGEAESICVVSVALARTFRFRAGARPREMVTTSCPPWSPPTLCWVIFSFVMVPGRLNGARRRGCPAS